MSVKAAQEWQFDGLVGPTHNYAGLAFGNLASENNAGAVSNPKAAALQGLEKMRLVRDLGLPQAFLPPQKRPIIPVLQRLGFGGGNGVSAMSYALDKAYKDAPHLLASIYSSSFMWAANAATVSPSADTADGKLHFTPANLVSHFHRAIEAEGTYRLLKRIFHNEALFVVHNILPATGRLSDEGAANHMIICSSHGKPGLEVFVYGAAERNIKKPVKFPARQQCEASEAIARSHRLLEDRFIMLQQSPEVIDAGVFHNDVIAMNTTRLMIAHEDAFVDKEKFIAKMQRSGIEDFSYIEIAAAALPVVEAVKSYIFNSQLLSLPDGGFVILAPGECEESEKAHMVLRDLVELNGVVTTVRYLNVRESMRNGGGPACLRLRVVMTEEEAAAIHPGVILTDGQYTALHQWVSRHYRDRLCLADLRDPAFVGELDTAYEALEGILGMPGFYTDLP